MLWSYLGLKRSFQQCENKSGKPLRKGPAVIQAGDGGAQAAAAPPEGVSFWAYFRVGANMISEGFDMGCETKKK